jgi:hypothetical protein
MACEETNKTKRLGLLAMFHAVQITTIEKMPQKPFNPLLGETYELIKPGKFFFLAEQVSHHPPISVLYTRGNSGYERTASVKIKTSFKHGTLYFTNTFKDYIDIPRYGERF